MLWWFIVTAAAAAAADGGVRLPDQPPREDAAPQGRTSFSQGEPARSAQAEGRGLLGWLGLDDDADPYEQRAAQQCVAGDLADCFRAQALRSFGDFFDQPAYQLSPHATLVRSEGQARALAAEPPQAAAEPRAGDSDWEALLKYGMRRIERFLRATALELRLDEEVTARGAAAPRFIDEIADEVDIIEDKHAPPFRRQKLKKLIIPMLLILKLLKLKLLLFLPLVLGLASFKKFLGFIALIVPGVIGYFKLCKPSGSPFAPAHYSGPQYSPAGVGLGPYRDRPAYDGYGHTGHRYGGGGVSFREHGPAPELGPQDLAYQGWDYRSKETDIKAGEA